MLQKFKGKVKKLKNQYIYNKECNYFAEISDVLEFDRIINTPKSNIKSICFVIPGMLAYSGGHTSILRLGTELSKMGYDIRYVSYKEDNKEEMIKNAKINLQDFRGEIFEKEYLYNLENDVVVATLWESAYYVKKMNGYKMYFVQDYEPYFFNYGEKFLLAKNSYNLGLHMVSLGPWNKHMISRECDEECDYIDFPYEKNEYKKINRKFEEYKNKKNIKMAVYVKKEEKRAPFIIQSILGKTKEELYKKNIELDVFYFGEDKAVKLNNGTNLGKLSKNELFELYKECDFGLVASLTNISLVPYEMIATNLPVIEFKDGTFKYFFDENCAILTSFDYKELTEKIYDNIQNPNKLDDMITVAHSKIENLSWQNSAKQFERIMKDS